MTDRKPDILTSWKIKQNTDGSYTAKCPAMPNVELTAENVVTILSKIERCLKSMYPDNSTVDGGISCINAEYSVTKRQEMSLDSFEMPTDDPTPEPATDAPELHEVQRTCENCGKITYCPKHNDSSDFIAPENCDEFQLATRFVKPIEQKKPRKSRAKKAVKTPVEEPLIQAPKTDEKKVKKSTSKTNCFGCIYWSSNGHCNNSGNPLYGILVDDPYASCKHQKKPFGGGEIKPTCKWCDHCGSSGDDAIPVCTAKNGIAINEWDSACDQYKDIRLVAIENAKKRMALYDRSMSTPYRWHRITELVAGCSICEKLGNGCQGNKADAQCTDYKCRTDAGSYNCADCTHFTLTAGNMGLCDAHDDAEVGLEDYACNCLHKKGDKE